MPTWMFCSVVVEAAVVVPDWDDDVVAEHPIIMIPITSANAALMNVFICPNIKLQLFYKMSTERLLYED